MPKGTEVQVGYLAPQSKQIFDAHTVSIEKGPRPSKGADVRHYLVRRLRLQLLKDLQRLLF